MLLLEINFILSYLILALTSLNERMWVPWEATHQLIKSNQAISCSELILGRGQTDMGMPFCPLPKNQSSKSVKSHASVITCVHIILKKSNKSIPWFIRIDLISDLIDDLINLIKSIWLNQCQPWTKYKQTMCEWGGESPSHDSSTRSYLIFSLITASRCVAW